jgi:hypothetical protein
MPRIGEVRPDLAVLGFTFALSLLTGLGDRPRAGAGGVASGAAVHAEGLGPRRDVRPRAAPAASARSSCRRSRSRWCSTLGRRPAAAQLPLRAVGRSRLPPDNLLTLQITVPPSYQTPDQRRAFYAGLFARLERCRA